MKRRLTMLMLCALPSWAMADQAEALSTHLGKAVGAFEAGELFRAECDRRDPKGASTRQDALAAWRYDNEYADYQRVMAGLTSQFPDVAQQMEPERKRLAQEIQQDLRSKPGQCSDFRALLDGEQFRVKSDVRRLVSITRSLGIALPDRDSSRPAPKSLEETKIVPLATLSARLEEVMAEVGSRAGARERSALRHARGERATQWLRQDGMQVLYGRVTKAAEMREWRDDQQSSFKANCRSFSEKAHEQRMADAVGQEMVLVGEPRNVHDATEGGTVDLNRCSLFTVKETGRPMLKEDDRAGLMLRPLEFDEAYAGPDQGIRPRSVDRVLYDAKFDSRQDGFGNGYIDRREDIYVLLRDGTAYLHTWGFPFSDLDVERSRKREPGRWFDWKARGDRVTLTVKGGWNKGAEKVLEGAQRLRPARFGRIDANYDYLQIGMGGNRQDRRYAFKKDGTVEYSRSGFVAGRVATSYIIVSGSADPKVNARYRIDGYALIIDVDGESERRFLAVPDSAKGALPDTVLINGTAYWLKD